MAAILANPDESIWRFSAGQLVGNEEFGSDWIVRLSILDRNLLYEYGLGAPPQSGTLYFSEYDPFEWLGENEIDRQDTERARMRFWQRVRQREQVCCWLNSRGFTGKKFLRANFEQAFAEAYNVLSALRELPARTPDVIAEKYRYAIDRRRPFDAQHLRDELMAPAPGLGADEARRRAGLVQQTLGMPTIEAVTAVAPGMDTLPKSARVVAVIVALENYRKDATNQIESVEFARADAEAFKALIEDVFKNHRPEVALLIDDRATYVTLRNEIAERAWGLGPDDLFVFYYAGHGFHDGTGNRLTVWDTAPINVEGTTLAIQDGLLVPLQKSPCQRVLAFIDACASKFKPVGRSVITPMSTAEFTELLRSSAFCATFLSCRPGEQSFPDHDLGHGVWTHYLLRALSGQVEEAVGPGRYITNASLQDYLRQEVPRHIANNPRIEGTQTPEAVVTATSTFAIRKVPEPVTVVLPALRSESVRRESPFPEAQAVDGPARFRAPGAVIGTIWDISPAGHDSGSGITLAEGSTTWLRLMPTLDPKKIWAAQDLRNAIRTGNFALQPFLGGNLFILRAEDGIGVCSLRTREATETQSVAFAFETGEIWAIDSWVLGADPARIMITELEEGWARSLKNYAEFLSQLGLPGPYRWIAGVSGVRHRRLAYRPAPGKNWLPNWRGPECLADQIVADGSYDRQESPTSALLPFFELIFRKGGLRRPEYLDR